MNRRVYPLNSLRAFEASARLLSFVKASEELFVTPAAVSHQVKRLESYLGVQLFRRLTRGIQLTETGQVLQSDLRKVFLRLDKAMERVAETESRGSLTISVAPVFAVKWLIPRLWQFDNEYPDIDVRMSSSLGLVDFQHDGFDAAVRLGSGKYPGLAAVKLFDESLTPVCSPRLLEGAHPLKTPDDLRHQVLLHNDSMNYDPSAPTWKSWLQRAGATQVDAKRGPHFSQPDHAIQAAIDGVGVVLGWHYHVAEDLAAGRLVQPFELAEPLGSAFYLVYPEAYAEKPKVKAFEGWLLNQIDQP